MWTDVRFAPNSGTNADIARGLRDIARLARLLDIHVGGISGIELAS
jgi:hypothetical protein